eukprot:833205_1
MFLFFGGYACENHFAVGAVFSFVDNMFLLTIMFLYTIDCDYSIILAVFVTHDYDHTFVHICNENAIVSALHFNGSSKQVPIGLVFLAIPSFSSDAVKAFDWE